jgi:hypothetical protein
MGVFTELPDPGALRGSRGPDRKPIRGNCHIHTPYSFSAFASVEDAFIQAGTEQVRLLGVNDFYTASAYPEFVTLARRYGVVPLLNMEFISLSRPEQERGIRVNDPNNPGRMYVSGKGFRYPFELPGELGRMLSGVRAADRERIGLMVKKTNRLLETAGARFSLSLPELERTIAVEAVRERHIARAIALGLERTVSSDDERRAFLTRLYGGAAAAAPLHDSAALENEIRGKILKSGGSAYVEEDPEAFLPLEDVTRIIVAAGGVPCYPVLLDDAKGNLTEFEADAGKLADSLLEKGFSMIELIPTRNSLEALSPFVKYVYDRGFAVSFGTEHNSPGAQPLTVTARGGVPLDPETERIGYEGACVIAAHQYLVERGEKGYVDSDGRANVSRRGEFAALGDAVIREYLRLYGTEGADR